MSMKERIARRRMKALVTVVALPLFLGAFAAPALACGWGGEDDLDEDIPVTEVGPNGAPLADQPAEAEDTAPDPAAANRLGDRYRTGSGVPQDDAVAVRWYRIAAEAGYAPAQNNLGAMYEHGRGVVRDEAEAAKWYRRAAEQGEMHAQHSLGVMLRDGRGVPRDPKAAFVWIKRSAAQGHLSAMVDLGAMYWDGLGAPRNKVLAYKWWSIAAAHGKAAAAQRLDAAAKAMTADEIAKAEKRARAWTPKKESAKS